MIRKNIDLKHNLPHSFSLQTTSDFFSFFDYIRQSFIRGKIDYAPFYEIFDKILLAKKKKHVCSIRYKDFTGEYEFDFLPKKIEAIYESIYIFGWKITKKSAFAEQDNTIKHILLHRIIGIQVKECTALQLPKIYEGKREYFGFIYDACFKAKVKFTDKAAFYIAEREWCCDQKMRPCADGSLELTLSVQNEEEFISWLLSFGDKARLLSPEWLVTDIVDKLYKLKNIYPRFSPPYKNPVRAITPKLENKIPKKVLKNIRVLNLGFFSYGKQAHILIEGQQKYYQKNNHNFNLNFKKLSLKTIENQHITDNNDWKIYIIDIYELLKERNEIIFFENLDVYLAKNAYTTCLALMPYHKQSLQKAEEIYKKLVPYFSNSIKINCEIEENDSALSTLQSLLNLLSNSVINHVDFPLIHEFLQNETIAEIRTIEEKSSLKSTLKRVNKDIITKYNHLDYAIIQISGSKIYIDNLNIFDVMTCVTNKNNIALQFIEDENQKEMKICVFGS